MGTLAQLHSLLSVRVSPARESADLPSMSLCGADALLWVGAGECKLA